MTEFDPLERKEIEEVAAGVVGLSGGVGSVRFKDEQIQKRREDHAEMTQTIRDSAGGTISTMKSAVGGAVGALIGRVPGTGLARSVAGSPGKAAATTAVGVMIATLTIRQQVELQRIRAIRQARGRPDIVPVSGERREGFEGRSLFATLQARDAVQQVAIQVGATSKAAGEGHGWNSFTKGEIAARRSSMGFTGGNSGLMKAVNVMESRFNAEIEKGWKVAPVHGG